jgi:signal transduction histidine kinase
LKFAYPGREPIIEISCAVKTVDGQKMYELIYKDNGIGFRKEHADKIFEVFYRLHTKVKYEGTGVGLAIVKKIISLHNGSITASGMENMGASFEIVLPEKQSGRGVTA